MKLAGTIEESSGEFVTAGGNKTRQCDRPFRVAASAA
jgi:hypothetical protein